MPVNYQNGIIYRIYDNTNGDVYYGSTANVLRYRMGTHKSEAKSAYSKCKSKSIILNDDYFYSEVEKYPCNSKKELETRERYYIENFTCVNKNVPTRTGKEWREDNKEAIKAYRVDHKEARKAYDTKFKENNKEELSVYFKKYYQEHKEERKEEKQEYNNKYKEDHKEEIKEYNRKYSQDNKERLTERYKKHYEDNKERLSMKHNCLCGGKYRTDNKKQHENTARHQKYITDNTIVCIECK